MALAPSPIDLTTIEAVKSWLGMTGSTGDDAVQRAVTNVSRTILSVLQRQILPASYVERYDGFGAIQQRLVLKQWPVIAISAVSLGNTAIAGAPIPGPGSTYGSGWLLSPGADYPPGAQQWLDFHNYWLARGSQNVGVSYSAGYQTAEAWTIPGSPYQVTLAQVLGWYAVMVSVLINGVAAVKVASNPAAGQYSVTAAGVVTFAAADTGKAAVITYGYVPQDLAQAAIEWISFRLKSKDFIGLVSKSLGGQESVTFSQKDMPDFISTSLQPYRRVF